MSNPFDQGTCPGGQQPLFPDDDGNLFGGPRPGGTPHPLPPGGDDLEDVRSMSDDVGIF